MPNWIRRLLGGKKEEARPPVPPAPPVPRPAHWGFHYPCPPAPPMPPGFAAACREAHSARAWCERPGSVVVRTPKGESSIDVEGARQLLRTLPSAINEAERLPGQVDCWESEHKKARLGRADFQENFAEGLKRDAELLNELSREFPHLRAPLEGLSLDALVQSLLRYGFKDELGHPLENCAEFQELVCRAESL